jgi:protein ImuB
VDLLKKRLRDDVAGRPLVLFEKEKSALVIAALDGKAARLGLYPGQALAEARAMHPGLYVAPADAAGDARAFRALCEKLLRYSPFVGMLSPGDVVLDITGGAHLFGGEAALLDDVLRRLTAAGIKARSAIADSPGCACALAHYGRMRIAAPGEAKAALADLPVAALRLSAETVAALRRLGLQRIGQLYELPRAPLAARFGAELLTRLAQALGEEKEPISPLFPAPDHFAEARLVEPIATVEAILAAAAQLAPKLESKLETAGLGARRVELTLLRVDNVPYTIFLRLSRPSCKAAHLLKLLERRLEDRHDEREAGFGYDALRLCAFNCARLETAPLSAFEQAGAGDALPELIDRLVGRLGPDNVGAPVLRNSHIPEKSAAFAASPFPPPRSGEGGERGARAGGGAEAQNPPSVARTSSGDTSPASGGGKENAALRPLKLLPAPEPIQATALLPDGAPKRFVWRRVPYAVKKAAGPERISPEWWTEDEARTRDYYRVEDEEGRRFWLYREGLYGLDASPQWFLHGFFG